MVQRDWRMCGKCKTLFFDGDPSGRKGACPADGHNHTASGFMFVLAHDVPESARAQGAWRFCVKCFAMFFDGFPQKGVCNADLRDHAAAGFVFVLPHGVSGSPTEQTDWRFCKNCFVMFFARSQDKGSCAHGGGHEAQGFNFVLPHIDPNAQIIDHG
jgi:hypothetical protein